MMNVTFNNEKNGIEVRFESKPSESVLSGLKDHGFRWSNKQRMWFAKKTEDRVHYINSLLSEFDVDANCSFNEKDNPTNQKQTDLWELTRIPDDINNVNKDLSVKEIAAVIRKHIKQRFTMCRFSITCGGSYSAHSINVDLLSSPFEKGSYELNAIIDYVCKYVNSFRYCTDYDPYGDYGSSYNFYSVRSNDIVSYGYDQRAMSDEEAAMVEDFLNKKKEFDAAELVREELELQASIEKQKKDAEIYMAKMEIREKNRNIVENSVETKDVEYFAINCFTTNTRKEDSIDGYFSESEDGTLEYRRETCKVAREVYMDKDVYEIFSKQLMDDYSFLEGMGGSRTEDYRISTNTDFQRMSDTERSTVEWYNIECVAVFCEGELKCIVDPQGFSYARYVYFIDDESKISKEYTFNQVISREEYEANCAAAECLEDISFNVIVNNNLRSVWDNEAFDEYERLMVQEMKKVNYKLHAGAVRAIKEDGEFKTAMYKLLKDIEGIQYQFENTGLEQDQKITIINISDFGGIVSKKVIFKKFETGDYAQYKAVKMTARPEGKRKDYYLWLYNDVIIYDGWIDIPEELLWDVSVSNGMICKKSRFLSCDQKQYDVIIEYFMKIGKKPIINTYNSIVEQ